MKIPDFFIVGAPKCGTTALATYLSQHPDVFFSTPKELGYFGNDIHHGRRPRLPEAGYLSHFVDAGRQKRVGEGSTVYLYSASAPSEIKVFNPTARIIVMLRNPVDMMYSLHSELLFRGTENIADFAAALGAEEERRTNARIPVEVNVTATLQYRRAATFSPHLKRYIDVFGRPNVHVTIYDDLNRDAGSVYNGILRFLELDPDARSSFSVFNPNKHIKNAPLHRLLVKPPAAVRALARALLPIGLREKIFAGVRRMNTTPRTRPPMDPQLRKGLQGEFVPEVERLGEILGRDLSSWCRSDATSPTVRGKLHSGVSELRSSVPA
jgi:hypothetical protein